MKTKNYNKKAYASEVFGIAFGKKPFLYQFEYWKDATLSNKSRRPFVNFDRLLQLTYLLF